MFTRDSIGNPFVRIHYASQIVHVDLILIKATTIDLWLIEYKKGSIDI
jgi:hypothetical protein